MSKMTVKLGFVPSYRRACTPWCQKMRADSIEALRKVEGLELVVPQPSEDGLTVDTQFGRTPYGCISGLDQAEAMATFFQNQQVDGLILCPLDFGDERSASKVAERLRVPVLLYATKEPAAPQDPSLQRVSDSYCGNLSMASGLYRRKLPFHYAGIFFPTEAAFVEEVTKFVGAVSVVSGLKGARLGQVGVRPAAFETVAYDEVALIKKFGQNVICQNLADIVMSVQAMDDDDPRVQATVDEIRAGYAEVTVADDYLIKAAKLELALADFCTTNRLSAMAVQCWPSIQQLLGISVCAVYGRLTQRGLLTACETDILGAVSMLTSYRGAMGRTLPHFIDWTIQHRENPNWLLAWHCGNAPACLAAKPEEKALRSRLNMTGELDVNTGDPMAGLAQFQVKAGPVTICRLAEYDDEWKLLIARGEIVPSDEVLAGTWSWVQVRDHAALYRTLVEEGFVHHASMIHGDQKDILLQACKFLGIKPIVVE